MNRLKVDNKMYSAEDPRKTDAQSVLNIACNRKQHTSLSALEADLEAGKVARVCV